MTLIAAAEETEEVGRPAEIGPPSGISLTRRFLGKRLAAVSLVYLILVVLVVVLAPVLAPYGPAHQDLGAALTGPSSKHLLGAGNLGLDVLSRILYGGRITLLAVVVSMVVFCLAGVPAGMVAGYRGGRFEQVVLRSADLVFAIPVMIVLLVVLAIFPHNELAAMAVSGLLGGPGMARVVRAAVLGVREELYVRAAVAAGIRDRVIIRRHVLPRVIGTIIVQASVFGSGAILLETGLGFLGLGSTGASWGNLVAEASQNLNAPWLLVPSGTTIILFIMAVNLAADGLRDALTERHTLAANVPKRRRITITTVPGSGPDDMGGATDTAVDNNTAAFDDAALLSVRGLTVALPIEGELTTVVSDVSFDLHAGEVLGIVGESGCGKSVTASALLRLLPPGGKITAGSVRFEGHDLTQVSSARMGEIRGGKIGWISQDPVASLDPSFTAGAQVAEAVRVHTGCSAKQAKARTLELFEAVRLPNPAEVAGSYAHQLSGGMAQRVGIAAALAGNPTLVIADEPTTALDVTVQAEILDLLRDLQRNGTAVVLITHDWGVISDLCDKTVVMYAGEVVERGAVEPVIYQPLHPYSTALLRSDPHHVRPGQPLPTLEGVVPPPSQWPTGCHFQTRCPLVIEACRAAPIPLLRLENGARSARCIRVEKNVEAVVS